MKKYLLLTTALVLVSGNVWAEEIQTSGSCGETAEDCSWRYEDGKLTITGNGEMKDYRNIFLQPWYQWKNDITELEISGITTIGPGAFNGLKEVTNVKIPASVKILGDSSFAHMNNLENVTFEQDSELTTLGWAVFIYDSKLTTLEIPEMVKHISGDNVHGMGVSSLVLPKGVFEQGGYLYPAAFHSDMTIYCPKEYQEKCENYFKTAKTSLGDIGPEGNYISPIENITLQTYEKDGDAYFINGKWYEKPNDVLTGKHIKKLRYTVEEAMKATEHGDKFHVYLTYK